MRQIFATCCGLAFALSLSAQGIFFEHGSWPDALAKARAERKFIFVDAVTSWCGPCKMMAKEVFPDSSLGAFFNKNFVSLKLDMERGEGIEFSSRYKVWVYPTLLFLDTAGNVLHRSAGYHAAPALLDLSKTALDPSRNLAGMERRYAAGDRRREFMLQYLEAKSAAYDPEAGQIANLILKSEDDLGKPEIMDILMRHVDDPYADGFKYLLKNRPVFEEKYGKREVSVKIEQVFEAYLQSHPGLQLGEVQRLYSTVYPERGEELASRYRLDYYRQRGDNENFARTATDHYTRYPSDDADELNEMVWLFTELVSSPEYLNVALIWAERSVALQEASYNQYNRARLLAKLDKKAAARKAAERALELAKIEGEDTLPFEEFMASLKKK